MTRDEEIAYCMKQRQKAWDNLNLLSEGMRVKRGPASGPMVDVTEAHKEREADLFNYWSARLRMLGVDDA